MSVLNAPQVGRYVLDLATAHESYVEVSINARSVYLVHIEDGQELELALAPEGPYFPIRRPGKVVSCELVIPAIYLRNAAGSGSAVFAFSPGEIAFDFPAGGGGGSSPLADTVTGLFSGITVGDGVTLAPVLDAVTGIARMQGIGAITNLGGRRINASLLTAAAWASAQTLTSIVDASMAAPVVPLLNAAYTPELVGSPVYFMEDDIQGYVPAAAVDACFSAWGWLSPWDDGGVLQTRPLGLGLMAWADAGVPGTATWHLVLNIRELTYSAATPWTALNVIDVDTGIPIDEWHRWRLELEAGEVRAYCDGVLVASSPAVDFDAFMPGYTASLAWGNWRAGGYVRADDIGGSDWADIYQLGGVGFKWGFRE